MKVCSKCKVEKDESEFYKNKSRKSGLEPWCKTCKNSAAKSLRYRDIEKTHDKEKKYRKENSARCKLAIKKWTENNRDKTREIQKRFIQKLPDSYVKRSISQSSFNNSLIPQDLVDFHREVIRAKRLLKELQK